MCPALWRLDCELERSKDARPVLEPLLLDAESGWSIVYCAGNWLFDRVSGGKKKRGGFKAGDGGTEMCMSCGVRETEAR